MGCEIPVFFMPIDESDAVTLDSADSVWEFIGRSHERPDESGLRSSTSRNFWHITNVQRYAERYDRDALYFLDSDITVLKTSEIIRAIGVLAKILGEASGGFDRMPATCTDDANSYFLQLDLANMDSDASHDEAFRQAYRRAMPAHGVKVTSDAGFGAAVDFFSFLKSLFTALSDALLQGKSLLFVRPSP